MNIRQGIPVSIPIPLTLRVSGRIARRGRDVRSTRWLADLCFKLPDLAWVFELLNILLIPIYCGRHDQQVSWPEVVVSDEV